MAKILTRKEALEEMRKERIEVEEEVDAIIKQMEDNKQ